MSFIHETAALLDSAAIEARAVKQVSHEHDFSLKDAYEIQRLSIEHRYTRGEKLIGLKMGFTSEAKMKQMGVHDMIWGRLTSSMFLENGGTLDFSKFIHPRAEPEICFRINSDITTELTLDECYEVVDGIAPAIEIIDSRYQNFKFALNDVIADNCSSAAFVVGNWLPPQRELSNLDIQMKFDGVTVARGSSADILGNPWKSLQAAARLAAYYLQPIPKGSVLLAGAATNAEFIKPGMSVYAEVEQLGSVGFQVT